MGIDPEVLNFFRDELEDVYGLEKSAIFETIRHGWKAGKSALLGGTKLRAAPGAFQPQRTQAVSVGTDLMGKLRRRGVRTHRARVKSPSSMQAQGLTEVPDDLLGMQAYAKGPDDVEAILKALREEGVTGIRSSAKTRPGYHGVNIKGLTAEGVPLEFQASPGRVSNMGQMMEHSLGYKQTTEAPRANWFDKWVGRKVAPRMVQDASWIGGELPALRRMGVSGSTPRPSQPTAGRSLWERLRRQPTSTAGLATTPRAA